MHVAVERGEPLLPVAVHVVGQRVSGLLHRFEEGPEQGTAGRAALQDQRAVVAPVLVVGCRGQARLHALEVRQAVGIVPRLHPGVRRPPFVVQRIPPLEDHPVDAAGAPQQLPPGVGHPAAAHEWLGFGFVLPVVEAAADGEGQGGRHVDEDVPPGVGPARLQHEHPGSRIRRQPVGQGASGRASTDDDEVEPTFGHGPPPRSRTRAVRVTCAPQ